MRQSWRNGIRFPAALIAALLVLLPLLPTARAAAPAQGDLDGDGEITAADAAIMLRAAGGVLSFDNAASMRADVTGNQAVNTDDAAMTLYHVTGLLNSFDDIEIEPSSGLLGAEYIDRFSYNGIKADAGHYRSRDVNVTVDKLVKGQTVCYVADIYIRNIESFRTAANGDVLSSRLINIPAAAKSCGAIVAISGDNSARLTRGVLVRNGSVYRMLARRDNDICVLYRSGVMETYAFDRLDLERIEQGEPYQSWTGGPRLLIDGEPIAGTASGQHQIVQRVALGYYRPGHYCFVVVDGGQRDYSAGMSVAEIAALMHELGCAEAFLLNGERATVMASAEGVINRPRGMDSGVTDMLYIAEPPRHGIADTNPISGG